MYPSENVTILWFTDGIINVPEVSFTWDQKLYSFLFSKKPNAGLTKLCRTSGGDCWNINDMYHLILTFDNAFFVKPLHLKVLPSFRVNQNPVSCTIYLKALRDSAAPTEEVSRVYLSGSSLDSYFPMPEAYFYDDRYLDPESQLPVLVNYILIMFKPPRESYPTYYIYKKHQAMGVHIPRGFETYCRLDVEANCALFNEITAQPISTIWFVGVLAQQKFIEFGFVRHDEGRVRFHILPFRFFKLFKIISEFSEFLYL